MMKVLGIGGWIPLKENGEFNDQDHRIWFPAHMVLGVREPPKKLKSRDQYVMGGRSYRTLTFLQVVWVYVGTYFDLVNGDINIPATYFKAVMSATHMQDESAKTDKPVVLSGQALRTWFLKHKGVFRAKTSKPDMSEENKKKRLAFCKQFLAAHGEGKHKYYFFIDEKWFYLENGRTKMKCLPKQAHESEGAASVPVKKLRNLSAVRQRRRPRDRRSEGHVYEDDVG